MLKIDLFPENESEFIPNWRRYFMYFGWGWTCQISVLIFLFQC